MSRVNSSKKVARLAIIFLMAGVLLATNPTGVKASVGLLIGPSGGTGQVITASGGQVGGLNSVPVNPDHAVPLGYLQANYSPTAGNLWSGTLNGTIYNGTTGAGNVGIGTTGPGAKLEIYNSNATAYDATAQSGQRDNGATLFINNPDLTANNFSQITFGTRNSSFGVSRIVSIDAGGDQTHLAFITELANAPSEKMRITSTGNVGIGTTNPDTKLQVGGLGGYGNNAKVGIFIGNTPTHIYDQGQIDVRTQEAEAANKGGAISLGGNSIGNNTPYNYAGIRGYKANSTSGDYSGYLALDTSDVYSNVLERLRIDTTGNVGIGTTTPNTKLQVYGGTGTVINVSGGQVGGLASVPILDDQAVPFGFLKSNYAPLGTGAGAAFVQGGNSFGATATLGTNDNNTLNFETNNGTRMTILAGGNVGIGTTNPMSKLSLSSSATMADRIAFYQTSTGNALRGIGYSEGGDGVAIWSIQNDIAPTTSNPAMFIKSVAGGLGNVGIGTTTPFTNLQISDATHGYTGLAISDMTQGADAKHWLIQNYQTNLYLKTQNDALNTNFAVMTLQRNGNVGIGTTAPTDKLQVYSNDYSSNVRLGGANGAGQGRIYIHTNTSTNDSYLDVYGDNVYKKFSIESSPLILNASSGGNVGIGTTTPTSKLHINGGTGVGTNAGGGQIGGLASVPLLADQAVPLGYLQANYSPSGGASLWGGTLNGTIYNGTTGAGNVGIGTTAPGVKLQVLGVTDIGDGSSKIRFIASGGVNYIESGNDAWNASPVLHFTGYSGTNGTFTFDGNVGIGTTNPGAKLNVVGDLKMGDGTDSRGLNIIENYMSLGETENGATTILGNNIKVTNGVSSKVEVSANAADGSNWIGLNYSRGITFNRIAAAAIGTQYDEATGELMRITTGGNVGIGTTGPTSKLHINGGTGVGTNAGGGQIGGLNSTPILSDQAVPLGYLQANYLAKGSSTATGDLNMGGFNILNVNKLTVNTIDPLYTLNGINYSTYASSISGGVKEEYVGKAIIATRNANNEYEKVIDFASEPEGSDLWVWRQVISFSPENVEVFLTPYGSFANTYYLIQDNKLIFRSDRPVTLSYRLIGRRFDWLKWPTKATNQKEKGMMVTY